MKSLLIMLVLACTLSIAGCGFLNPVQKKDSMGNVVVDQSGQPVIVAAGSQYLEQAQGVLQMAGAFPMFGSISSGIASLLGVGVLVSNRVANNRKNALTATVAGVSSFSENYAEVQKNIVTILRGSGQSELASKIENLSVKSCISNIAGKIGVWKYLDGFVQKVDPKTT